MQPQTKDFEKNKSNPQAKHKEGPVAKAIEKQKTAKIPSDIFLWLAGGSIATSLILQLAKKRQASTFVGQWAPTVLILGLYNKLVKLHGSEEDEADEEETESSSSEQQGMGSRAVA